MFKFLAVTLLVLCFQKDSAAAIPNHNVLTLSKHHMSVPESMPGLSSEWIQHIRHFVNLIDVNKLRRVVMSYSSDPEVQRFIGFLSSDDFKKTVWEFESIAEFKEAIQFLENKGYHVDSLIDYINKALSLPPYRETKMLFRKTGTGITGLIRDLVAALPMDEIKKLFEHKLETSPEVAQLFQTINSQEFISIMQRMSQNPKLVEIKKVFESYGVDFSYLCGVVREIFGKYYRGIFCG